jgi:NADPH2:quinone reductase
VRAVLLHGVGGPEQLLVEDVPEPVVGAGQALVDVRAAGVNFADVLIRLGRYPEMPELPTVLGSEVAGELEGARVMGFATRGYAERALVERDWVFALPEGASFAEGAAFPIAFLTAWIPLTELVRVGFGSRVLVTAAAGATGSAALQVVRALNGRAVAAVGSRGKIALARSLGAVEAVTYEQLDEIDPVDAVFELVGEPVFSRTLSLVRPLGAAISVGYAGGLWADVSPAWLTGRNIGVHGFFLGRLMKLRPDLVRRAADDVLRLWEAGVVRPIVGHEFPLEQAGEAHLMIEERRTTGKVVLVP